MININNVLRELQEVRASKHVEVQLYETKIRNPPNCLFSRSGIFRSNRSSAC